jgi:hypothetical protein
MTTAHEQSRRLMETISYPEHDPRSASAEYRKVHNHLIDELDEPCWICGVRKSTLNGPENTRGSTQLETHHYHVEWALANAVDPAKLIKDFPELGSADSAHLRQWLDSEGQMLILCDVCHRHPLYGIHQITYPAWVAQRWLLDDWDLATGKK